MKKLQEIVHSRKLCSCAVLDTCRGWDISISPNKKGLKIVVFHELKTVTKFMTDLARALLGKK